MACAATAGSILAGCAVDSGTYRPLRCAAGEICAVVHTDTGKPPSPVGAPTGGSVSRASINALDNGMVGSSTGDGGVMVMVTLLGSGRLVIGGLRTARRRHGPARRRVRPRAR